MSRRMRTRLPTCWSIELGCPLVAEACFIEATSHGRSFTSSHKRSRGPGASWRACSASRPEPSARVLDPDRGVIQLLAQICPDASAAFALPTGHKCELVSNQSTYERVSVRGG